MASLRKTSNRRAGPGPIGSIRPGRYRRWLLGLALAAGLSAGLQPMLGQAGHEMIPANRRAAWHLAGVRGDIPTVPVAVNVKKPPYSAAGDGRTDDTAAIQRALAAAGPGAIYFPAGRYLVTSPLEIRQSLVLRGAGPSVTQLLFRHNGPALMFAGRGAGAWVPVSSGYTRGSTSLTLARAGAISPGSYAEIQQRNDPGLMYTLAEWNQPWAQDAVGQLVQVVTAKGNRITLDAPLNLDFKAGQQPVIRSLELLEWAGVEDLRLTRLDRSDNHMIHFKNTANVWVRNCISDRATRSHVLVERGYHAEIRDCFFNDGGDWLGGHAYGVELRYHTTASLVENNIFYHLRHAMMVHVGANGNVFGYNYSRAPYQNDGSSWTPPDISIHGHYPFANLFEGNIVHEVGIADYWGPSGPYNTFFRNQVVAEHIEVEDSSDSQNIVGNELVRGRVLLDTDPRFPHRINPATLLIHANRIGGRVVFDPAISDHKLPASYYLSGKPAFYGSRTWPSLGADKPNGTNPARERFNKMFPVRVYLPLVRR